LSPPLDATAEMVPPATVYAVPPSPIIRFVVVSNVKPARLTITTDVTAPAQATRRRPGVAPW